MIPMIQLAPWEVDDILSSLSDAVNSGEASEEVVHLIQSAMQVLQQAREEGS